MFSHCISQNESVVEFVVVNCVCVCIYVEALSLSLFGFVLSCTKCGAGLLLTPSLFSCYAYNIHRKKEKISLKLSLVDVLFGKRCRVSIAMKFHWKNGSNSPRFFRFVLYRISFYHTNASRNTFDGIKPLNTNCAP